MNDFEEKVKYFIDLVCKNIQIAKREKPKNMSRKEMIFFNFNVRLDGQEIIVYNQQKDITYDILTKKIQNFDFQHVNKESVLNTISLLTQYVNNKITFKKISTFIQ